MRAAPLLTPLIVALALSAPGCRAPATAATAGFWYDDVPFALPAAAAAVVGGMSDTEFDSIRQTSRAELERAFAGWRIRITDSPRSFWRVEVMRSLRSRGALPDAGESLSFGWLGGSGGVSFELVAVEAVRDAPNGASRRTILDGIGRGIGRVAAHELAHQIVNTRAAHNDRDADSYEYPSPDRASQYYGELHWITARPFLEQQLR